jgi:uncharacterized membrane protein YesL
LWIICCVPIFTVGASTTALYYAYNKAIRQKRSYAFKEFFHGFKISFKQSTVVWLIVLLLYVVTIFDIMILRGVSGSVGFAKIVLAFILAMIVLLTMWVTYVFPYMARFENHTKAVLKNSAIIMIANLPWSILLLVLFVIAAGLFLLIPMFGMFAPALYVAFANLILERIFRKYMSEEDLESEKEIEMYSKR